VSLFDPFTIELVIFHRHLENEPNNEKKNLYLQDLQSRNETLYFRTLVDHIDTMAPLVYTPTVGVVCEQFGHQFRRSRYAHVYEI
jgi:malic enzyme